VAVSETVTLVMTDKGMNTLMVSSVKLGGDASVAAGPVGAGANRDVTTDFVAFSRSKGVYGGLNLEGSVIDVAENWNRSYYGMAALPPDILVRGTAHNEQVIGWQRSWAGHRPASGRAWRNSCRLTPQGRAEANAASSPAFVCRGFEVATTGRSEPAPGGSVHPTAVGSIPS
jgi:hypothetical protein